ncbi:MAG TPA: 23S rRNA (uracil(1939)-C(5))-methyltransferase RlmD [Saprospiraceae bacterium]|nr:23S rRNA (uracil(1939)-C(5))-methyltransferase RlmD [Saprospiraceae bacterium]
MPRPDRKPRKIFNNVDIIDTADEGLAIGRCEDGLIIQVRGAVPGDKVNVEALDKRKGMYMTRVTSILTFSPDRVEPFCSHFGTCGGCKWQHMDYDAQVRFKEKKVHDAFQRIGGLDTSLIKPIVKAPSQRYYRNKLEFTATDRRWLTEEELARQDEIFNKNGIGFHLVGAFDKVLDIQHCYLQADPSNDIRHFVKQLCIDHNWSFSSLRFKNGFLRNIIVRNNLAGDVMVILVVGENEKEWITTIVNALKEKFLQIISIYSCYNHKVNDSLHDLALDHLFGETGLIETLGTTRFKIGPKSFFQTNSAQAFTLYSLAKEMAALKPEDNVYDLYCGVGSLGIFMADQCRQVVGIEQISEAIIDAKANAELNGFTNTQFVTGQVEMILEPGFISKYGKPDVILTDPPRMGMHPNVIPHLLAAAPNRIVYVSCNPATQARDLKMLSEDYDLVSAVPVDMFPHTHHIECVALLLHK